MTTIEKDSGFVHIVLQPTSICNLNCRYCYLPGRREINHMSPQVTTAIATSLENVNQETQILWHGGEALASGIGRFTKLIEPFEHLRSIGKIRHSVQTNGTLISDKWCEFIKHYNMGVGVSIDGPRVSNARRVDWNNNPAFDRTISGIRKLQEHTIPFRVIAVVSEINATDTDAFYEFFRKLGCENLAINVEEQEGLNRHSHIMLESGARQFWKNLFQSWAASPDLAIREFDRVIAWMRATTATNPEEHARAMKPDMWPTISTSGDVVVLAPELMAARPKEMKRFVVGNVLEKPLTAIMKDAREAWYAQEYRIGVNECRKTCPYFSFCGGGHASNKYYETGSFAVTETRHCRNYDMSLVEGVLDALNEMR